MSHLFCHKLTLGLSLVDKLQYAWLCGNFWIFKSETPGALFVGFLMMDSTIKTCCWIIYLIAGGKNSDLKTERSEQEDPSFTTIPIIACLLTAWMSQNIKKLSYDERKNNPLCSWCCYVSVSLEFSVAFSILFASFSIKRYNYFM
jgi:hypothetical protein